MKSPFPAVCLFLLLIVGHSFAGSATWNLNPTSRNWNTAANWTPETVPNGPSDTATFDISNNTSVSLPDATEVSAVTYAPGASAFTVAVPLMLTLSGAGITNDSGITQNFIISAVAAGFDTVATLQFSGNASAGDLTIFTNQGYHPTGGGGAGQTTFFDDSTAGTATIVNDTTIGNGRLSLTEFFNRSSAGAGTFINVGGDSLSHGLGGQMIFTDDSTASDGTFIVNGGDGNGFGALLFFQGNSSAGNGNFTINGPTSGGTLGARALFFDNASASESTFTINDRASLEIYSTATAGNATLIANDGGTITFQSLSSGGTARIQLSDRGTFQIRFHDLPNITIGSLEGRGIVDLGHRDLTIGSNDLSTVFSGRVQGFGSLTKIGTGALTLVSENGYSGGTTISAGALLVKNATGSATGTGAVTARGGILGGRGIISGTVTVGNGRGTGAVIAPSQGVSNPTMLTLQNLLTFKTDGSYLFRLNTSKATADQVVANGVMIESGAQFNFKTVANKKLTAGTIFTAINNIAATPINGTFANLADGSTVTVGANKLQVSYSGGDGNDLTLTVVQ